MFRIFKTKSNKIIILGGLVLFFCLSCSKKYLLPLFAEETQQKASAQDPAAALSYGQLRPITISGAGNPYAGYGSSAPAQPASEPKSPPPNPTPEPKPEAKPKPAVSTPIVTQPVSNPVAQAGGYWEGQWPNARWVPAQSGVLPTTQAPYPGDSTAPKFAPLQPALEPKPKPDLAQGILLNYTAGTLTSDTSLVNQNSITSNPDTLTKWSKAQTPDGDLVWLGDNGVIWVQIGKEYLVYDPRAPDRTNSLSFEQAQNAAQAAGLIKPSPPKPPQYIGGGGGGGIFLDTTPPVIIITSPQNGATVETEQVRLEGKIDGVAFSELRTLTQEGENILTKTAQDPAGNRSSASVTVYLRRGELVSPQGGEVSSPEGEIKLVIPSGALDEPTRIRISPVDTQTLEEATPQGSTLLAAVKGPAGLSFNKPVSLIYTLPKPEIPGTAVELGLYDPLQNRINSTGQTSVVPADGSTLTFSITSFSTYVALKSLAPQSAPIGAGVKIPLPDMLTGAYSHSIPITIPPGRKGIQPAIALNYRSANPNSWVGLGFSLNPGYIARSTRLGPPTYNDTQDTFYFITDSGATELVWLIDNLYQAKVESSFARFFKENDDSWKVVGKDGSILRLGQAPEAKEGSSLGTFAWYLTRTQETNGNYITYNYVKDQGKSYLSRIDYTGNEIGVSPKNSVEFFLEPRDDIASSYINSVKVATARRLKEIQAKVNGELVWRYVLEYSYSPDTNRSLLKSITQYGSDGKSLPAQSLSYQKAK